MKTKRFSIKRALALAASAPLGMAGLVLLFADVADDAYVVRQIGWLTAILLTKILAVALSWASYKLGRAAL